MANSTFNGYNSVTWEWHGGTDSSLANGKRGHWSAWPNVNPSEMQRPVGGKAQQQQVWCDLGAVRPYVTVSLSVARVLRIDDSTHPLARRAARPDCDGTCRCCWRRRLASRTPPLRSFAWLHRWCRGRGQSSASSSGSFSSSSSPARNLCGEMWGGGGKGFPFFFPSYRLINSLFITDDGLSAVKLWRVPLDNTGVLPHAEDFNCLGGIWNIWGGGKM